MAVPSLGQLTSYIPTDALSLTLLALLPLGLWLYTALMSSTSFPTIRNSHILLLIAHPDDEAMFFSPTLVSLTRPALKNTVKILCLSNGNADGLGATRRKELVASAQLLGVDPRYVVCLDEPDLQDSMTAVWPAQAIASVLSRYLLPSDYQLSLPSTPASSTSIFKSSTSTPTPAPKQPSSTAAPPATHSDIILTFDASGVSGHPNHTSLFHAASAFTTALRAAHPGWASPLSLYTLTTVSLPRKYAFILDVPASVLFGCISVAARSIAEGWQQKPGATNARQKAAKAARPSWLLYVSGVGGLRRGQRAMYTAHRSQMRWFRWGWIGIGRYMVVNDLRRVV